MSCIESSLIDFIAESNNRNVALWKNQKQPSLRFGREYLGISWMNELGWCEYKFECENAPFDSDLFQGVPQKIVSREIEHIQQTQNKKDAGTMLHGGIATDIAVAGKRPEINLSIFYNNVLLRGRIDFPVIMGTTVNVVDWKTGDSPYRGDPWNGDVLQVLAYCFALRTLFDSDCRFSALRIRGTIAYTKDGSRYTVDYDDDRSVVRPGFSQFRQWSKYTPSTLAEDKLFRLWTYWMGFRDAVPSSMDSKHRACEYRSFCPYSPYRVVV